MAENNSWGEMKAAEWRGKVGEVLEDVRADLRELRLDVERVAETVHRHAADIAVIDERCRARCARAELSSRARAIIGSAVIMALASVVVALISLLGG
jgi:ParB-like chromosome segregation protein Spo0J